MEKTVIVIGVCLLLTLSVFSGCVNVPKEFTQFSIVSFNVEPGIINQGEYANLSWIVINASSVNIDNGIGIVALTGRRIIQPTQTTTYIVTASNATTTKSATAKITVTPAQQIQATNITISDGMNDVSTVDYLTGKTTVVTSHPDIDVDNLDLVQATYTQQGTQATASLQVKGNIENRGKIRDPNSEDILSAFNTVEYGIQIITSKKDYSVSYSNQTGQLLIGGIEQINLTSSDFSVVGDTLTISFKLTSAAEAYSKLSVTSTYIKANFSSMESEGLVYLSDLAPNPPLVIFEAYASNIGSIGESIQFNGSVEPLTGQPPYTYRWDFGDQSSSTKLNPTHIYTKAGVYTYTFTVTDNADATASQSGTITINSYTPQQTPNIACTTDATTNRIQVAFADSNIKWNDIVITNDSGSPNCHWTIYDGGGVTNRGTNIMPTSYVTAGDYILIWGVTGNVRITLRYVPTNSLLGSWTINV